MHRIGCKFMRQEQETSSNFGAFNANAKRKLTLDKMK